MNPLLAAARGLAVGVLATVFIGWVSRHRADAMAIEPGDRSADLRRLVDVLGSAAVVVGAKDDILAHNEAAVTEGVVRGDRIGILALLEAVREARRTGEPRMLTVEVPRNGRRARRLGASVVPTEAEHVVLVVDDRVPTQRAEEAARDILATATHELKTPIGGIGLLAEAIEEAADDPEAVRRFARRVQSEAWRLGELVAQIIQLSRLQGDAVASPREVPVNDLVASVFDREGEYARRRGVRLIAGAGASGLRVLGDVDQLGTALANLVRNAITYSDDGGRVVVTVRAQGDGDVAIAVSDNGIGIAPEDAERIFERFYRVDYARSRENGGSGLGLSIVEEIVAAHGGSVGVWSAPGNGSTFTIVLPAASKSREPDHTTEESS